MKVPIRILGPAILLIATLARADLIPFPNRVVLTRAGATQRIILERKDGDRLVADVTRTAGFRSSDENVVRVDEHGIVTAVSDGTAFVTARSGDEHTHIEVK